MRRTKIVATLGPATDAASVVEGMVRAGMDCARLNFSHASDHEVNVRRVRDAAAKAGRGVAVMADLQGPKIRVGPMKQAVALEKGGEVVITVGDAEEGEIPCIYGSLAADVGPGDPILIKDGTPELEVISVAGDRIFCKVIVGGTIDARMGINLPGTAISAPSVTEKDWRDLQIAVDLGVDFIALSFVRRAADVAEVKTWLEERDHVTPVIAKIERPEALEHIEEILEVADGIMVARGDLGVEVPLEQVPIHQKQLLRAANKRQKVSITATQMMESMIESYRPTRAEVSDVANAIFDGTGAVMLSGETAVGIDPVGAVEMLARISQEADAAEAVKHQMTTEQQGLLPGRDTAPIVHAACHLAAYLNADALVAFTERGTSPMLMSGFRPSQKIVAVTASQRIRNRSALFWGVLTVLCDEDADVENMFQVATRAAVDAGRLEQGDKVVMTAGVPLAISSSTNMIRVLTVE